MTSVTPDRALAVDTRPPGPVTTPDPQTAQTPRWLLEGEMAMCPCGCVGRRKKGSFVEKTLDGSAGLLRHVMFGQDVAQSPGFLQRVDPRVKLVSLLLLLVAAAVVRHISVLLTAYVLTLLVARASAVPVGFFVKRVWLFVPIFTGIVVIPATFSFITPGEIVVPLWTWNGQQVGITAQGLQAAGLIVSRVALSISLVVLLTITTPWVELLSALRALHVPRMFVLVVGMAYRYIFLLLGSVTDMYESRRARQVGAEKHDGASRAFVSSTAGALLSKSHQLSEEVHMAMVARGFRGDAKTLSGFDLRRADYVFLAVVVTVSAVIVLGDHLLGL
jgi:cobalt/nickel transport system permease protein